MTEEKFYTNRREPLDKKQQEERIDMFQAAILTGLMAGDTWGNILTGTPLGRNIKHTEVQQYIATITRAFAEVIAKGSES